LRELRDNCKRSLHHDLAGVSMGMSHDFEAAIAGKSRVTLSAHARVIHFERGAVARMLTERDDYRLGLAMALRNRCDIPSKAPQVVVQLRLQLVVAVRRNLLK